MRNTLFVKSIFRAIDGEVNGFRGAGQLTTFLRLAGCNLRCTYCDTKYALQQCDGKETAIAVLVDKLRRSPKITITGGEPFEQIIGVVSLIKQLGIGIYPKQMISIETNGSYAVPSEIANNPNVRIVMDYKMPSSGMEHRMSIQNFLILRKEDVVKFVLSSEDEYTYMKTLLDCQFHMMKAQIAVSPALSDEDYVELSKYTWAAQLAELLIEDEMWDIQYSLQIHKVLWPNAIEER